MCNAETCVHTIVKSLGNVRGPRPTVIKMWPKRERKVLTDPCGFKVLTLSTSVSYFTVLPQHACHDRLQLRCSNSCWNRETVSMMVIFWVLGTDDDFVYHGYTALFAYRSFLHLQQRYILSFFDWTSKHNHGVSPNTIFQKLRFDACYFSEIHRYDCEVDLG